MEYDPIGQYHYAPGYCARDAFRRALGGDHPIVMELPYCCSIPYLDYVCERYGFPMYHSRHGGHQFEARIGQKIIWILADCGAEVGHVTFCTDPRRIARAQERGEITVGGYILLED